MTEAAAQRIPVGRGDISVKKQGKKKRRKEMPKLSGMNFRNASAGMLPVTLGGGIEAPDQN